MEVEKGMCRYTKMLDILISKAKEMGDISMFDRGDMACVKF